MAKPVDKSNLGYLGPNYQYQLVKCFVEEPGYFQEVSPIVDQNTFTEPLLKRFVGVLKDYQSIHNIVPSYSTLSYVLKNSYGRTDIDIEEWDALIKQLRDTSSEGSEYVKESATKFFRQQNMVKVAQTIIQKATDGDGDHYDECIKMMQDAINIGQEDDIGVNPYDIEDEVLNEGAREFVPTGIDGLDEVLCGGLDKRKLGVVIGPAGFGKTTFATSVAAYASTCANPANGGAGYKVVQICFEDDIRDLSKKHFSKITQVESKDLLDRRYIGSVRQQLDDYVDKEMFKSNLLIKKYKTNTKGTEDIRNYLKRLINAGFRPDLVIIDYFECIKLCRGEKNASKWDLQEITMREIEKIAEDFNVALWLTTQGNKESFSATIVDMAKAGGSVTKVQIGHVVISIARANIDAQMSNTATLTVLKNRQGASGKHWDDMYYNNGTSTIMCNQSTSYRNDTALDSVYGNSNAYAEQMRNQVGRNMVASGQYEPVIPAFTQTGFSESESAFENEGKNSGVLGKKGVTRVPVKPGEMRLDVSGGTPTETSEDLEREFLRG